MTKEEMQYWKNMFDELAEIIRNMPEKAKSANEARERLAKEMKETE